MEPAERLQAKQDVQRLRAELGEVRASLARLRESAWPEEKLPEGAPPGSPADLVVKAATEASSIAELINTAYSDGDSLSPTKASDCAMDGGLKIDEDQARKHIEAGSLLACGRGSECRGCCVVEPPSGNSGCDAAAPFGTVSLIAVHPEARRQGVALRLLSAAEELLAGRHQCGEVRIELSAAQAHLHGWLERRGYEKLQVCGRDPESQTLSKTLPLGFVSRSLLREVAAREAAVLEELAQIESREVEALRAQRAAAAPADDDDAMPSIWGAESALSYMPQDVWAAISSAFCVRELGALASTCRVLAQEAGDPEAWRSLCMAVCWPPSPALLAFAEGGAGQAANLAWREVFQKRAEALPVIVVDVGRGYTKYGLVHGVRGRPEGDGQPPGIVQLCSSPTHPSHCDHSEQLQYIHSELDRSFMRAAANPGHLLHRSALAVGVEPESGCLAVLRGLQNRSELNGCLVHVGKNHDESGRWQANLVAGQQHFEACSEESSTMLVAAANLVRVRRAQELPILIGEPFATTASRVADPRSAAEWNMSMKAQLADRTGPVKVVPQAQMALWAHGIDHGVVVNIGQGQTIAMPVVRGEIKAGAACVSDMGSGPLTQLMMSLLRQRFNIHSGLMTWCRDLKEMYCYVSPPMPAGEVYGLRSRLASGGDVGVRPVTVDGGRQGLEAFELRNERVLVPEAFFDRGMLGGPTVPELILGCVEKVKEHCQEREEVQALLRNIVLVGGAADLPGIRPRTEHEVRALLKMRASDQLKAMLDSSEDVFVLNPPLLGGGVIKDEGADAAWREPGERTTGARPHGVLCTPRFAPFAGGCVRAVSSQGIFQAGSAADAGSFGAAGVVEQMMREGGRAPLFQEHRGTIAAWVRNRLFDLNAPVIFRTGGGGGEDDGTWGMGDDSPVDSDEELSVAMEEDDVAHSQEEDSSESSDKEDEEEEEEEGMAEQQVPPPAGRGGRGRGTQPGEAGRGRGRSAPGRGYQAAGGRGRLRFAGGNSGARNLFRA